MVVAVVTVVRATAKRQKSVFRCLVSVAVDAVVVAAAAAAFIPATAAVVVAAAAAADAGAGQIKQRHEQIVDYGGYPQNYWLVYFIYPLLAGDVISYYLILINLIN